MSEENYYIPRRRYQGIRARLRKQSGYEVIEMAFSLEEFIEWYNKQEKKCVYCGITEQELLTLKDDKMLLNRKYKSLTIDRKDNQKGYKLDNIVLACMRCNSTKSDFFTFEEMKEIGEKYIKPKIQTKNKGRGL